MQQKQPGTGLERSQGPSAAAGWVSGRKPRQKPALRQRPTQLRLDRPGRTSGDERRQSSGCEHFGSDVRLRHFRDGARLYDGVPYSSQAIEFTFI